MGFFKKMIDFFTLGSDRPVRRLIAYYIVLTAIVGTLMYLFPVVDRVIGSALQLFHRRNPLDARLTAGRHFRIGVHDADRQSAPCLAERTDARLPDRDPGHDVLVGQEPDELIFRIAAAGKRCAGAGDRRELDERPAIHG